MGGDSHAGSIDYNQALENGRGAILFFLYVKALKLSLLSSQDIVQCTQDTTQHKGDVLRVKITAPTWLHPPPSPEGWCLLSLYRHTYTHSRAHTGLSCLSGSGMRGGAIFGRLIFFG